MCIKGKGKGKGKGEYIVLSEIHLLSDPSQPNPWVNPTHVHV